MVALVEENAGEQSYEVHFGSDHVCSELRGGEIDNAYFLDFIWSLNWSYWWLLSSQMCKRFFISCGFLVRRLRFLLNEKQAWTKLINKVLGNTVVEKANISTLRNFIIQKQRGEIVAPGLIQAIISEMDLRIQIIDGVAFEGDLAVIGWK